MKLTYDILLSIFAFNFHFRRYSKAARLARRGPKHLRTAESILRISVGTGAGANDDKVGRCRLTVSKPAFESTYAFSA